MPHFQMFLDLLGGRSGCNSLTLLEWNDTKDGTARTRRKWSKDTDQKLTRKQTVMNPGDIGIRKRVSY